MRERRDRANGYGEVHLACWASVRASSGAGNNVRCGPDTTRCSLSREKSVRPSWCVVVVRACGSSCVCACVRNGRVCVRIIVVRACESSSSCVRIIVVVVVFVVEILTGKDKVRYIDEHSPGHAEAVSPATPSPNNRSLPAEGTATERHDFEETRLRLDTEPIRT